MKRSIILSLVVAILTSFSFISLPDNPAEAARWMTCNGSPVKWRGTLNVHRNRCSIPDTGRVNSAYWNGVRQWDRLSSVVDGFFVNPASDCSSRSGDGQNEIGLANRSVIDGNDGLTRLRIGLCFIGSNSIDEADIFIANDLNFFTREGNVISTNNGRSTFVHEFGHFFGFLHDDIHAIMRTLAPDILTGGIESATVWPGDTIGMNSLYGFSSSRANALPSALGVSGSTVRTLDAAGRIDRCRGDRTSTRMYLGNYGNRATGTYSLRIRLNQLGPFAGGYIADTRVVQTFTHSMPPFSQGTFDLGFTIPSSLSDGTYNIYIDLDHPNAVTEIREGDNTTVSARRIRINC